METDRQNKGPEDAEGVAVQNRCSTCVLPLALDNVDFDAHSTCQFCNDAKNGAGLDTDKAGSSEELEAEMDRIRDMGKGRQFDALIGLSGGRDSSYLAYLLVRKHKLRCLAAYYRTPFTQDITDANVRRIAERLDIPLVEMPASRKAHLKAARAYFLRWCKDPRPEYAALCCAGCKFLNRDACQIARKRKIRSIVFAGNPFETIAFLPSFRESDSKRAGHSLGAQFSKITTIFRRGLKTVLRCPPSLIPMSIKASLLYLNPHSPYLRLRYPGIHRVDYFFYAPWSESECVETIQTHLGWEAPPNAAETWKADCDFAAIKNYMFYKMYGATYNDALYSNMIRAGELTRDEAVNRIRQGAGLPIEAIERAMHEMGLSMDLIDRKVIETALEV